MKKCGICCTLKTSRRKCSLHTTTFMRGINTMPEWLKDLIVAIGGGTVVLVGILTIFKKLFVKLFETGIESSFEKSLEKYRNKLSRSTKAYEILLDREMRFYERIEPIFAELVPLEHDLLHCSTHNENTDRETECTDYKICCTKYVDNIKSLKNEILLHQTYIPNSVFESSTAIVFQMQEDLPFWVDVGKSLFAGEYEKFSYETKENTVDIFLSLVAKLELSIRERLEELSKIS